MRKQSREPAQSAQPSLISKAPAITRRTAISWMACSVALVAACDGSDEGSARGASGDAGGLPDPDAGLTSATPDLPKDAGLSSTTATNGGKWARGGTAALAGSYPDPFVNGAGSTCEVFCKAMLGPCYARTVERQDISEGLPGLPVRLSFLVVDPSCKPVPGVSVDIWHARNTGAYSAEDTGLGFGFSFPGGAAPPGFMLGNLSLDCHLGDEDSKKQRYFRGVQTTNEKGRVDFNTCFPGWYKGRCVHIHFTVRRDGVELVTSQLYFPDTLTSEIFAEHPDYAARGQPDTINSTDGIYQGPQGDLDVARQPDGAMLASKTLVLRFTTEDELCGTDGFVLPT
jgi:protocatechuate 3,4-dioxygenase beta subunit